MVIEQFERLPAIQPTRFLTVRMHSSHFLQPQGVVALLLGWLSWLLRQYGDSWMSLLADTVFCASRGWRAGGSRISVVRIGPATREPIRDRGYHRGYSGETALDFHGVLTGVPTYSSDPSVLGVA